MKKSIVAFLFIIASIQKIHAGSIDSTKIARTSVYLELLGNCVFYSGNGDFLISKVEGKNKMSISLGAAYYRPTFDYGHRYYITSAVHYLRGEKHHLDISLGPTIRIESKEWYNEEEDKFVPFAIIGAAYRMQKPTGGFFFKIGLIKYFPFTKDDVPFWGGIDIGYTFKHR